MSRRPRRNHTVLDDIEAKIEVFGRRVDDEAAQRTNPPRDSPILSALSERTRYQRGFFFFCMFSPRAESGPRKLWVRACQVGIPDLNLANSSCNLSRSVFICSICCASVDVSRIRANILPRKTATSRKVNIS
jgi:hypothetical protein